MNHLTSCLANIVENKVDLVSLDKSNDVTSTSDANPENAKLAHVLADGSSYVVTVAKQCCMNGCQDHQGLKLLME